MLHKYKFLLVLIPFFIIFPVLFISCQVKNEKKNKITNIEIWTYYSGASKIAFDKGIEEFNKTVGKDNGIYAKTVDMDTPWDLDKSIISSCDAVPGALQLPNLIATYSDTAVYLHKKDKLLSLDDYFTKEELDLFVPSFIEEGRLTDDGPLLLFPALKSSEIMFYNKTDWAKFEKACGISIDDISSIEKLIDASEVYYNWTDSLTPELANDGKALFGRDSLDNYFLFGLHQFGYSLENISSENLYSDEYKKVFRKLWDSYYVPYIRGRFSGESNFRNNDMAMGKILACVATSASVNYYSEKVTLADNSSYNIEVGAVPEPLFEGTKLNLAVQQGAGICVLKNNKEEDEASILFLKWLSQSNVLSNLAINSGYIPALKEPLSPNGLDDLLNQNNINRPHQVATAKLTAELMLSREIFAPKPFKVAKLFRFLFVDFMQNKSKNDRKAVVKKMSEGFSLKKAAAPFLTDQYFDDSYKELCKSMIEIINEK